MRREGHRLIIATVNDADYAAVSAAMVCTDQQLWKAPEVGNLYEIAQKEDTSQLPIDVSVDVSRKIVSGLQRQAAQEGDELSVTRSRLRALLQLQVLDLPARVA